MPTLALPDWDVHYQRIGEHIGARQDVVLIHGLGANLAFWYLGGGRHLANSRQLLLYDLRGHGRSSMPAGNYRLPSMAEDLHRLLAHLGLERVHVVGHSFGGRVALAFAGLYPEKVRSLVVADTQIRTLQPSMRLRDWPHWAKWKAELMELGLKEPPSDDSIIDFKLLSELNKYGGDLAGTGRAGAGAGRPGGGPGGGFGAGMAPGGMAGGVAGALAHRGPSGRMMEGEGGPQRRISLRSREMGQRGQQAWNQMLATTTASQDFEDEAPLEGDFFARIDMPTLLLFGALSHCLPTAHGLLERLPHARLVEIPRAGHFFPVVEPIRFARAVDRFFTINEQMAQGETPHSIGGPRPRLRAAAAARLAAERRGGPL